jgi:hypothetical protein
MKIICNANYQAVWDGEKYTHHSDQPTAFNAYCLFESERECADFCAKFPKSFFRGPTYKQKYFHTTFYATSVNDGKNETGIKKVKRFLDNCGEIEWQGGCINSYKTLDAFYKIALS